MIFYVYLVLEMATPTGCGDREALFNGTDSWIGGRADCNSGAHCKKIFLHFIDYLFIGRTAYYTLWL